MKPLKLTLYFCLLIHADLGFGQRCNYNFIADAPDKRYIVDKNGTVVDKITGLIWMRCALGQTWNNTICTGSAEKYIWEDVLLTVKSIKFAGFNDWRLPNQKELQSLIESRCDDPSINVKAFPNASDELFWSSSPYESTGYAWIANFSNGYGYTGNYNGTSSYAIRLLRGKGSSDFLKYD